MIPGLSGYGAGSSPGRKGALRHSFSPSPPPQKAGHLALDTIEWEDGIISLRGYAIKRSSTAIEGLLIRRVAMLIVIALLAGAAIAESGSRNLQSLRAIRGMIAATPSLDSLPGHPNETLWRGLLALHKGDAATALPLLSAASAAAPGNAIARAAWGQALAKTGRMAEALAEWSKLGDGPDMIRAGWDALGNGRVDDGLLAFRTAQALAPQPATGGLAYALLIGGNPAEAEATLTSALESYPDSHYSTQWHILLGQVLSRRQEWSGAAAAFEQVLAADPDNIGAHYGLAVATYHLAGLDAAVIEMRRSIALEPDSPDGYTALGDLYFIDKHYAEAGSAYAEALARGNDRPALRLRQAAVAVALGDDRAAIAIYLDVAARFAVTMARDELAGVYRSLAHAYWRQQKGSEAMAAIERALALDERDVVSWLSAARIYAWQRRNEQATAAYEHVLVLDPANTEAAQGIAALK